MASIIITQPEICSYEAHAKGLYITLAFMINTKLPVMEYDPSTQHSTV